MAVLHHDLVSTHLFQLLLRKSGDVTPLLHAMRIGQSHRDVSVILLGAFSRWVNHLEDDDIPKPRTKTLLKALRNYPLHIIDMPHDIFSLFRRQPQTRY